MSNYSTCFSSKQGKKYRLKLFQKQHGFCHICGLEMQIGTEFCNSPEYATFDHLIPRSKGGSRGIQNILLAHQRCNEDRANRLIIRRD